MENIGVVVRYLNGKVLKGHTLDFFPNKTFFHLMPLGAPSDSPIQVSLNELKALFFVRSLEGQSIDPQETDIDYSKLSVGRKVEVIFTDGEVMTGAVISYDPNRLGFFLNPNDLHGNNEHVFVIANAVKSLRFL